MKTLLALILAALSLHAVADDSDLTPLQIVNARMAAYNAHDIDAFLAVYSEDIQIYTYPNIALGTKGKAHLRGIFEPLFDEGQVNVEIHQQITQGNYVINHETVSFAGKDTKYVSIYEVKDGLIVSVQFVRE
ncbi:MAG: nuclear transport factor 2 family protein [Pseudomonadota bacterium]